MLISPLDGKTGLGREVKFEWSPATDPDGDPVFHILHYSTNADFTPYNAKEVSFSGQNKLLKAGIDNRTWLMFLILIVLYGIFYFSRNQKGIRFLAILLIFGILFKSCHRPTSEDEDPKPQPEPPKTIIETISNLDTNTTYYWKVLAADKKGGKTYSTTRSFTTSAE